MNIYKKQSSKIIVFLFALSLFLNTATAFAATNIGTDVTTDGNVQAGSGSLVLLGPKADPDPVGINGAIYYNTTNNKFRCYEDGAWKNCITLLGSASLSSIVAAVVGNIISNGDNAQRWDWQLTTADKTAITFGENVASTAGGEPVILKTVNMDGSTTLPLLVENLGNGNSFRVNDSASDSTPFLIDKDGRVAIGSNSFDWSNPEMLKVDAGSFPSFNIITATGNLDNYLQMNISNRNSGANASSDIVATADNGDENVNYIDMGINSSGYSVAEYSIGGKNDGYLYVQGVDAPTLGGNLAIGTGTTGKVIKFHTGGNTAADEKMRIDGSGMVGIATTTPGSELDVKGTLRLSGATSGYVGLAPAAIAGSTTYILPAADGAGGQALVTDGLGQLSWASASSNWQRTLTTLSPMMAGDNITTSGDISTSGTGTITSVGLITGSAGADISGADVEINKDSNFNTYINTGSSTGTVNIGSSVAGAVVIESASTVTLQGGANTITSPTGEIKFQAADSATTGLVKIGDGGGGSDTPDLLALDVKNTASDPALVGTPNGAMYYNANTNKFRCYVNGGWTNCASAALDTIIAAVAANTINNGDNAQRWNWSLTTPGKKGFTFGENVASIATGESAVLSASTLASSTAMPLFVENLGNGYSFRVNDSSGDTSPFIIDSEGHVLIGTSTFGTPKEMLKVEAGVTDSPAIISAQGSINDGLYVEVKNRDAGTIASSAFGATANDGDATTNYATFGIASSGYNNILYPILGAHDAFLFNVGDFTGTQGGNMIIGTGEPGKSVIFLSGGGADFANEQMRINSAGNIGMGTATPGSKLDVNGEIRFSNAATDYVGFTAPAAVTTSTTYTLPAADGTAGQALVTDGGGVLSWASETGVWSRDVPTTTISPVAAGDDITTSGDIYTTGTGTMTSAGLFVAEGGITATLGDLNLNTNGAFNTNISTGAATGAVNIGNTAAAAIAIVSGGSLTLTGGTDSTWGTATGDITLQPGGTSATKLVKIGGGGLGTITPDILALDVKSDPGDPGGGTNGAMYYNANTNKFRCYVNAWVDCDTTGGTASLQSAYNNGATITTAGGVDIAFNLANSGDDFTASGAGAVLLTPTGASSFTSSGALTLTGGAASTWSTSSGALTITSATDAVWGTATGNLTLQANGAGAGSVKIGTGGSTTPDLFGIDVKSDSGDPGGGYNGAMYYNGADALFRCYEAGGWKNCGASAASATTLQQAYTASPTITTSGADLALILTTGNFTASGAGSVLLTPTGASSFTSGGALTLTGGGASSWTTTAGALTIDAGTTTPDALNLGTTNATAVNLGHAGITTINEGTLQTGDSDTAGILKIADGSLNYVTLKSPAIGGDYTLTLPTGYGTDGQALITDSSGNLSWTNITGSLMTTEGDMLYRDGTGNARLPRGTNGQILQSSATTVGWVTPTGETVGLGNVTNDAQIPKSIGTAKGDLIAYNATPEPVRLPIGETNGFVLTVDSTQATGMKWAAYAPVDDSLDFAQFKDDMTVDANTSIDLDGKSLIINDGTGGGALSLTTNGAALTLTSNGTATWAVTGADNDLTIDAADVLNLGTTNATAINIGKAGVTTINEGTLQTGDSDTTGILKIADGSSNYVTLKSPAISADYILTFPVDAGTNGQALTTNGTGTLSWSTIFTDPMATRGDLVYRNSSNITAALGRGAAGFVLKSDGTDIAWAGLSNSDVGLGNVTNHAQLKQSIGTAQGQLITFTGSDAPVVLTPGSNGQYLTANSAQETGLEWVDTSIGANSLNFTEFNDSMTVDENTSINLNTKSLIIEEGASNLLNLSANSLILGATIADTTTINSKISIPSGNINDGGTSNTVVGRVTSGGGNTTVVVNNSLVTTSSHVFIMPESSRNVGNQDDEWFYVTRGAGSFTITGALAFTDGMVFSWFVIN